MEYKRIKRTLVYEGSILDVYQDTMEISNGHTVNWDYIGHKGAAAIIAEDADGKIIMVRQYRNTLDGYSIEIPAGGKEPEEDMAVCAARELEEETGYRPEYVEHLMDFIPAIAYSGEVIGIYYSDRLVPSLQNFDEDEDIEVLKYSMDELVTMVLDKTITDGKTIAAIMTYKALKERK